MLGPKALPPLMAALTNQTLADRDIIAGYIGNMGNAVRPAIPTLLRYLNEPDPELRYACASILLRLKPEPAQVIPAIPALIDSLDKPFVHNYYAVKMLEYLGPVASNAVPVLLKTLTNADGTMRKAATNALGQIDPSALKSLQR
jgi:HEAT repeat protein